MQAMVLEKQGPIDQSPLVWRDVAEPEPGAGEVRVKVSVCAICRTDLHVIEGDLPAVKLPLIPGHQVVGAVDRLGRQSTRFRLGQRIGIAWLRHTDGTCRYCRRGRENLCDASRYTGYHADGGYARYAAVPEDFAYELPEGLDDAHVSPLLCAGLIGYRAYKRATPPEVAPETAPETALETVPETTRVLLVGFGSSAHLVIQLAVAQGHEVYVCTRSPRHQQHARRLGAVWASDDLGQLPCKMDSAILFAPVGGLIPPVMAALDKGGTCSLAGIHMSDIPAMNYERHLFHDKTLVSCEANTREDGRKLLRLAGEAGIKPDVTTYALRDANRALQDMKHSRVDGTGVLVMDA